MIGKNLLLAFVLSLLLTLALAFLYTFYPILLALLGLIWQGITSKGPQTGGIGAVAGGVSKSFLITLVIVVAVSFLIIFAVLQKRSRKRS